MSIGREFMADHAYELEHGLPIHELAIQSHTKGGRNMAKKVLILGESGTGKTTSLRNFDPSTVAVVNPVGKELPFKGGHKFQTLDGVTDSKKITSWMKEQCRAGKKVIVVDDFQYILSVPYMNRIKEAGWDKWNDFGANYFDIIDVCKELPEDVVVYYMSHTETLENGVTGIKLIGKLLREKITIEGLFTIVLMTTVSEGKYYFLTQNSGKDTVKSPMGMFPSYAIDNDLKYVDDKIRNYYEFGEFKTDDEMKKEDEVSSAPEVQKSEPSGRRSRTKAKQEEAQKEMEQIMQTAEEIAGDRDAVPFDEVMEAPQKEQEEAPKEQEETKETEAPKRRTRRVR